ncbi:MAG TPA: pyrimidine 5'-nucleotidase [Methyloversatilis sp.]
MSIARRAADAGHGPVWLFDLDNTLHDANPHVFPHLNRAMTAWLMAELDLDEADANRLRIHYWHRYGATLLGLMRHHGTQPRHFLHGTHDVEALRPGIVFERALRHVLRRLPGRKIVFTNGPLHYAEAVLDAMDMRPLFDSIHAIEHSRYTPKPRIAGFLRLLRDNRLTASRCIMVEDTAANLRTARQLGMRTVWISRSAAHHSYVDLRLSSALQLPRALRLL